MHIICISIPISQMQVVSTSAPERNCTSSWLPVRPGPQQHATMRLLRSLSVIFLDTKKHIPLLLTIGYHDTTIIASSYQTNDDISLDNKKQDRVTILIGGKNNHINLIDDVNDHSLVIITILDRSSRLVAHSHKRCSQGDCRSMTPKGWGDNSSCC